MNELFVPSPAVGCEALDEAEPADSLPDVDSGTPAYSWPPPIEDQARFRLLFRLDGGDPRPP